MLNIPAGITPVCGGKSPKVGTSCERPGLTGFRAPGERKLQLRHRGSGTRVCSLSLLENTDRRFGGTA